jgi:hypothetical protein
MKPRIAKEFTFSFFLNFIRYLWILLEEEGEGDRSLGLMQILRLRLARTGAPFFYKNQHTKLF